MTTTTAETVVAEEEPKSDYVAATTEHGTGKDDGATASCTTYSNRKSKLFFGICDMRTAVVSLNVLNIVYSIVVAIVLSVMLVCQGNGLFLFQNVMGILTGGLATAGVSGLGLWSAMNWHTLGVVGATVLFSLLLLWRCLTFEWVDIIVTAFLLYPHIVLTLEMKSGVLSEATYPTEEFIFSNGRDFVDMAHEYISPQNSMV